MRLVVLAASTSCCVPFIALHTSFCLYALSLVPQISNDIRLLRRLYTCPYAHRLTIEARIIKTIMLKKIRTAANTSSTLFLDICNDLMPDFTLRIFPSCSNTPGVSSFSLSLIAFVSVFTFFYYKLHIVEIRYLSHIAPIIEKFFL